MNIVPLDQVGIDVHHHFSSGVYAKEVTIPAGMTLVQHRHKFDHMSVLASGTAMVSVGGKSAQFVGPAVLNIAAGQIHAVTAVTEVVWLCIHATDEVDPEKIDHEIVEVA